MTILLYNCTAEEIKLNKSGDLTLVSTLTGTLRSGCDIINPDILIETATLPVFNYAYIPEFNRYYFLRNITNASKTLWNITLHVDVLMSYKEPILRLKADVSRNEFDYDLLLQDNQRTEETIHDIDIITMERAVDVFKMPTEASDLDYRWVLYSMV